MKRAILGVALLAAALASSGAAPAQTVAAPGTEATAPVPAAAAPPADAAPAPADVDAASGPIATLQEQLKREGFAPGPVNGVMTEETRRALAASERRTRQPRAEPDPVKRVQSALQQLGLFAGPVDGVVGAQTRDAIIRFEAARHLTVDPRVSDRLLAELDGMAQSAAGNNPPASVSSPTSAPTATGREPLPPGVAPPPIH